MIPAITERPLRPFSVSNTQETSHQSKNMITLVYEDCIDREVINVPRVADLQTLSEQQQVQALVVHIKSVMGLFLNETKTGQQHFVLHGSVAMVTNMLSQLSKDDVRNSEIGRGIPSRCYFPLFDHEQSDLDFFCNKREINVQSIVSLLEKSLEGYLDRCTVFASGVIELTTIVRDKACKDREKDILFTTGRTQKIFVEYNKKPILTLDITYPPANELPHEVECRPYCKESKKMSVDLGGCSVEINVCSLEQLLDDLRNAVSLTGYLVGNKNKFLCRAETMLDLSLKGLLGDDIADRILGDVKEQKCVASVEKATQLKKMPNENKGSNTEIEEKPELKNIGTQADVKKISKNTSTSTARSLCVETEVCRRCASYGLTLEKAFSEIAIQTIVKKSKKMRKAEKEMSNAQKRDEAIESAVQAVLWETEKIICRNVEGCDTGKNGVISYTKLKKLLSIVELFCRYKDLLNIIKENKGTSILQKRKIIEVFEKSTERLVGRGSELIKNFVAKDDLERYDISALLSAQCVDVGFFHVTLIRTLSINEHGTEDLCAEVKDVELFYFKDVIGCSSWLFKIKEPIRYLAQFKSFSDVLSLHCKELCAMYLNNSLLYKELPSGLSRLIEILYIVSGQYSDDIYLEHIESYIKNEDYREVQDTFGNNAFNTLQHLNVMLIKTAKPIFLCTKILALSEIAYNKGFYGHAGVLITWHIKQMIHSQEYRKECHKIGVFKIGASQKTVALYNALKCNEGEENTNPQSSEYMRLRRALFGLSETLSAKIVEESGTIPGGMWSIADDD